ncbi:ACYL TRANSFERASE 4 [Salix purpurea]|uniref:ACYL TRANSFERASE 4 n=1 Tax=Salix purpurea TaxID=77065 RepID=A0A9Q0VAV0_SALPP|nr:ACYL TRANSFERASE 4 [Salix purpurea]
MHHFCLREKILLCLLNQQKPTPSKILSFSTIDNDPNLEFVCHSVYVYKTNSGSSDNGSADHDIASKLNGKADPACVIKDAISKVLVHYYPLAGKLKRDNGIDVETAKEFVFDFPSKTDSGSHPLMFQVTKFSCGGFTIGMGLSHSVCDGFGASQLFRALAELASGKSEPSVKPVWERERLVVNKSTQRPLQSPVDKNSLATSPYLITNDNILHECFYCESWGYKKTQNESHEGVWRS